MVISFLNILSWNFLTLIFSYSHAILLIVAKPIKTRSSRACRHPKPPPELFGACFGTSVRDLPLVKQNFENTTFILIYRVIFSLEMLMFQGFIFYRSLWNFLQSWTKVGQKRTGTPALKIHLLSFPFLAPLSQATRDCKGPLSLPTSCVQESFLILVVAFLLLLPWLQMYVWIHTV